ncbi:MAG: 16S rRNA (adenine(1518)-N(6)/adenine(1519)-N(6))-dimethyltransferase RsmA [Gammaproteobacteria bacterium]|nr:16S rRNA (adenine(1518)-N(6)/adenine(1519)-N(6))-dimethyltransferase RsmA [Gammaproteobacteria bacterium]
MAHRPRKRFGQHFLHDRGTIERILQAIDPRSGEILVEIGPGLGALTLPLLERVGRLQVIELDRDLVRELEARARGRGELAIHSADALRFDFTALAPRAGALRIVGNLPYNIASPLLFHLMGQLETIRDMHFMLQREVVERMIAEPGGGEYGRLSVMLQYRCRIRRLFVVRSGAFRPPPKVDSAFVRLVPRAAPEVPADDERWLERLVAQAFSQRRKTLRNALKGWVTEAAMTAAGVDPGVRPERLTVADYARLANASLTSGRRSS